MSLYVLTPPKLLSIGSIPKGCHGFENLYRCRCVRIIWNGTGIPHAEDVRVSHIRLRATGNTEPPPNEIRYAGRAEKLEGAMIQETHRLQRDQMFGVVLLYRRDWGGDLREEGEEGSGS